MARLVPTQIGQSQRPEQSMPSAAAHLQTSAVIAGPRLQTAWPACTGQQIPW